MSDQLQLFSARVVGTPAPQGSKRHVGNGRLVESSAELRPWRETVAAVVAERMRVTAHPGYARHVAIAATVTFTLHRPPSLPKSRARPTARPDIDKLLRAVLDALTDAGLLADDAQVTALSAVKRYAEAGQPTGMQLLCTAVIGT